MLMTSDSPYATVGDVNRDIVTAFGIVVLSQMGANLTQHDVTELQEILGRMAKHREKDDVAHSILTRAARAVADRFGG